MASIPTLSVVLPAFNEQGNIERAVRGEKIGTSVGSSKVEVG